MMTIGWGEVRGVRKRVRLQRRGFAHLFCAVSLLVWTLPGMAPNGEPAGDGEELATAGAADAAPTDAAAPDAVSPGAVAAPDAAAAPNAAAPNAAAPDATAPGPTAIQGGPAEEEEDIEEDITDEDETLAEGYELWLHVALPLLALSLVISTATTAWMMFHRRKNRQETGAPGAVALDEIGASPPTVASNADLEVHVQQQEELVSSVRQQLAEFSTQIDELRQRLDQPREPPPVLLPEPSTTPIRADDSETLVLLANLEKQQNEADQRLREIEARLARLTEQVGDSRRSQASITDLPVAALLAAERRLLRKSWRPFASANEELAMLALRFGQERSERAFIEGVLGLSRMLEHAPDVQRSVQNALAPLRDYYERLHRLSMVPELVGDVSKAGDAAVRAAPSNRSEDGPVSAVRETDNSESELLRVRNALQLLTVLQTTDLADRIRTFRLETWLRGDFLRFADDLLRARQAEPSGGFDEAWRITREALAHAGVEAVPIELGRTRFDSKVHVGRSDAHQPDKPDGVIVGVIKNGFRDATSCALVQRPEVVVNRV